MTSLDSSSIQCLNPSKIKYPDKKSINIANIKVNLQYIGIVLKVSKVLLTRCRKS